MIYKVRLGDEIIEGTAVQIIEAARKERFLGTDITLVDFVREIQENVWRLYGKGIQINHEDSVNHRCQQLVNQLIHLGLLQKVESINEIDKRKIKEPNQQKK